ncbi:MAG: hypothetical protein FWC09_04720 [Lachnospiraceae bacterium]|nr:hypothetical protein [Lachnospiraceae bacterium]
MFEKKSVSRKKRAFFVCIASILILFGCGQREDISSSETIKNYNDYEVGMEYSETEIKYKDVTEISDILLKPLVIPLNTEALEIYIYNEEHRRLLSNPHSYYTDGEKLYFLTALGFYSMPIGTDELAPINIEIPEGMDVYNFALDRYGRMHLIIAERDEDEFFIWRLDENYQVDKVIDISAYIETIQMPRWHRWFMVLDDGTYYIQWGMVQDGIIVSSDGELMHTFTLESLGIGWVRQVAVGKDGYIYIVCGSQEDNRKIVKLDTSKCLIEDVNPALYFPGGELFRTMSGGTDTNLLLYSIYSGVWACDTESGILENRVSLTDIGLGLDNDSDLWKLIILPDGRLFVSARSVDGDAVIHKYIPVGK